MQYPARLFPLFNTRRVLRTAKIEDRQSRCTNNVARQQLQPYGILSVILL